MEDNEQDFQDKRHNSEISNLKIYANDYMLNEIIDSLQLKAALIDWDKYDDENFNHPDEHQNYLYYLLNKLKKEE